MHKLKIFLIVAGFVLFFLLSCDRPEYNNPFDTEVLPEDWAPANLRIEVVDYKSIKLTWQHDCDYESRYVIERKTGTAAGYEQIDTTTTNRLYYVDSELKIGVTYSYRVYAFVTDKISSYSNSQSIALKTPTVITSKLSDINTMSVDCGGVVTSDGNLDVTARGVCWSTSPYPSTLDNKTIDGSGMGSFTSSITDLIPKTNYHVRAYATNAAGTGYGENKNFITFTNSSEMVFVEGGSFSMGDVWGGGDTDEKPVHTVALSSFYIGKYEVTQALYQEFMGTNPSYFKGDSLPVENVTWYNAVEFCNKMSEESELQKVYTISGTNVTADISKNGYRLPTEAEWEYAARSGGRDDRKYSGTNSESELGDYAWYDSNSGSKTHPVGANQPNDIGIYDMSGNVWEWCWDWKGNYSSSSQTDPTGPLTGSHRVTRSGSFNYSSSRSRTVFRGSFMPRSINFSLGFRLASNED